MRSAQVVSGLVFFLSWFDFRSRERERAFVENKSIASVIEKKNIKGKFDIHRARVIVFVCVPLPIQCREQDIKIFH